MKRHRYFVAYTWRDETGVRVSNMGHNGDTKLTRFDQIMELQKTISESFCNGERVVITSITYLGFNHESIEF